MRKKTGRAAALLLALALGLGTTSTALAARREESPVLAAASSQHMKITSPKNKAVYYKGETITFNLTTTSPGRDYVTQGMAYLDQYAWYEYFRAGNKMKRNFSSSHLALGSHRFSAYLEVYYWGSDPGRYGDSYSESVNTRISLRALKAPSSPKAKAGKGKVTVTWKKAAGASSYEVFRAGAKKGTYKKVASVRKLTYTDKKVTKGKQYFYKIRTVRSVHGTVRSGFSAIAASAKVR